MAAWLISSGGESKSTDSASLHGVVVFFMSLDILSVLDPTMFIVVDTKTWDNCARAQGL